MDKGLLNHYKKSLSDVKSLIQEWDEGKFATPKEAYLFLYQTVMIMMKIFQGYMIVKVGPAGLK